MQIDKFVQKRLCADGAILKEITFDTPMDLNFVQILSTLGINETPLDITGFFKIYVEGCFLMRGFVNDYCLEVRLLPDVIDIAEQFWYDFVHRYHNGDPDYEMIKRCEEKMKEKVQNRLKSASL